MSNYTFYDRDGDRLAISVSLSGAVVSASDQRSGRSASILVRREDVAGAATALLDSSGVTRNPESLTNGHNPDSLTVGAVSVNRMKSDPETFETRALDYLQLAATLRAYAPERARREEEARKAAEEETRLREEEAKAEAERLESLRAERVAPEDEPAFECFVAFHGDPALGSADWHAMPTAGRERFRRVALSAGTRALSDVRRHSIPQRFLLGVDWRDPLTPTEGELTRWLRPTITSKDGLTVGDYVVGYQKIGILREILPAHVATLGDCRVEWLTGPHALAFGSRPVGMTFRNLRKADAEHLKARVVPVHGTPGALIVSELTKTGLSYATVETAERALTGRGLVEALVKYGRPEVYADSVEIRETVEAHGMSWILDHEEGKAYPFGGGYGRKARDGAFLRSLDEFRCSFAGTPASSSPTHTDAFRASKRARFVLIGSAS